MSALENLRRCAELLDTTARSVDVQTMEFDELETALGMTHRMEQTVRSMSANFTVAQWQERKRFRDEPPLYCPSEVMDAVGQVQEASGSLPAAWKGYLFTLKGDPFKGYVMRIFENDIRDVVPADQAHTLSIQTDTLFDERSIVEKPAKQLDMSVFLYLTTQTNESKQAAVALCFA